MRRAAVLAAGVAAALAVIVAVAWLALPWVLESWGARWAGRALGVSPVTFTVADISRNRLELRDLRVGRGGATAGADSVVLTYDMGSRRLDTLIVDRARLEVVWRDGDFHLTEGGPLAELLAATDEEPSDEPFTLPVDLLRMNAAQVLVRSPAGVFDLVVEATASSVGGEIKAEGSISGTGPGLAAEAAFTLRTDKDRAAPWIGLHGSAHLDVTARESDLHGIAHGIDGRASLSFAAQAGGIWISSAEGLAFTARHIDESVQAQLPAALRERLSTGATLVVGGTGAAPLHVQLSPAGGDGIQATGGGVVSLRLGDLTARAGGDGSVVAGFDGGIREIALEKVEAAVNGLPTLDGLLHASLVGTDLRGTPDDLALDADIFVLGERLRLGDAAVPKARLLAQGALSWHGDAARMALDTGRLAVDGPTRLPGVTLPDGLDWSLAGADNALVLDLAGPEPVLRADLAVAGPELRARTDGRTITGRFASAQVRAAVPLGDGGAPRGLEVVLANGSVTSKNLDATGVHATLLETPQGLRLEADLQVPRLPGETTPLPEATQAHRPLRVRLEAEHQAGAEAATFTAQVREGGLKTILRLEGRHVLDSGRGGATVRVPRLTFGDDFQPGSLYGPAADAALRVEGAAAAQGTISWTDKGISPRLEVLLDGLTVGRGFVTLRQTHGVLTLTKLWPPATPPDQVLSAAVIDAGVPFSNAEMTFRLDGKGNAVIDRARMALAEGSIRADPVVLPFDGSGARTVLRMDNVRLDQLVALADLGGLSATGRLRGDVPVELRDGNILFHGGELRADQPGVIRYRPDEPPAALAAGGGGVDLMLQALDDFHYKALRLSIAGSAAGDLEVGLHLAGANPAVYDGYPLEFNLTLSGALAQVIEGSLSGYQIPDRIRRHMERFGVEQ